VCASESFAFIKRWVPATERRPRPSAASEAPSEAVATYRALLSTNSTNGESRMTTGRLLGGGAVGLALLGAAGWLLQRNGRDKAKAGESSSPDSTPGGPDTSASA